MNLMSLSIEHFRGYFDKQTIPFAIPDGKIGSGLTVIVGPNSAGKTTLLECLLWDMGRKFQKSDRHNGYAPSIEIHSSAGSYTYTNVNGGSETQVTGQPNIDLVAVPSRRHWRANTNSEWTLLDFTQQSKSKPVRNGGDIDMAAFLKLINKDVTKKSEFDSYLKEIIPQFTDWTIDTDSDNDYVLYRTGGGEHKSDLSGDGVTSAFRICAQLCFSNDAVVVIDEPELSLHPSAQKALASVLSRGAAKRQVVVCTHSPYFVNWSDFESGASFVRLNKVKDEKCVISTLDRGKKYSLMVSNALSDWQRPHLLDAVAKEILFAREVLFVEGQEDVGLIRKWFDENNRPLKFEIYGYGVGGYSKMPLMLELSKDLGLDKVAALFDMGPDSYPCYEQCKKDFPDFKMEVLSANDIRDKPDKGVVGVFDKSGNLKPSYKAEFESKMNAFEGYFSI